MKFNPKIHPTYKEQFDKITNAYFKNELNPLRGCACFIGNMLNGNDNWQDCRSGPMGFLGYKGGRLVETSDYMCFPDPESHLAESLALAKKCLEEESGGFYSFEDIIRLENNFLRIWDEGGMTEDCLFEAMDSTLDMLRQIHEEAGELIEFYPVFNKRELTV